MLQGSDGDVSRLKLHRETKTRRSIYLSQQKAVSKLEPEQDSALHMQMSPATCDAEGSGRAVGGVAYRAWLNRPVLDPPAPTGEFDFSLDSPDIRARATMQEGEEAPGASIFTAIQNSSAEA